MRLWLKRWLGRALAIFLCSASWLLAVGLLSFGPDWFYDTVQIIGIDEMFLNGVVYVGGPWFGAAFFFLVGVFILWAFWTAEA